jgi:hypothetical protein
MTLGLSLDATLFGDRAWGFHLTNVLLHAGVVAAFGWFLSRRGYDRRSTVTAMLVAGVHPLSWLPVGAISYRADLLAPLFLFLFLGSHERLRRGVGGRWTAVAMAAAAIAALLSKETALFWIPAVVAVTELAGPECLNGSARARWGVTGLVLVGYAVVRSLVVPALWSRDFEPLSIGEAVGTRFAALARQFSHLVRPVLPSLSDAMPVSSLGPESLIGIALTAAVLAAAVRWRRTEIGWVCGFVLVGLAPALNVVPLPRFTSPHYGYLAAFGMAAAVPLVLNRLPPARLRVRWLAHGLGIVWLVAAAASSVAGGSRFRDDERLFGPDVRADERFLEGHHYLGQAALARGDLEGAGDHLTAALKFRDDTLAYVDWVSTSIALAGVRLEQGHLDEADELLLTAARGASEPTRKDIAYNRALVATRKGDYERTVALLEGETWDRAEPMMLLARTLAVLGRRDDSIAQLKKLLPVLDEVRRKQVAGMIQVLQQKESRQ